MKDATAAADAPFLTEDPIAATSSMAGCVTIDRFLWLKRSLPRKPSQAISTIDGFAGGTLKLTAADAWAGIVTEAETRNLPAVRSQWRPCLPIGDD